MTRSADMAESPLGPLVRAEWGRMVAALARTTNGDIGLAEDSLQMAVLAAIHQWPNQGVPDHPVGWLLRTARHKAVDQLRRTATGARLGRLLQPDPIVMPELPEDQHEIPDDRLRLILTCCHPALSSADQLILNLKTVCGLTSPELARALLLDPRTAQQRVVRAKKRVRGLGLGWTDPAAEDLPARIDAVLRVVYLLFNEGYSATSGAAIVRRSLCREAIRVGAIVAHHLPNHAEVHGLMALMLLQDARAEARQCPDGTLVLLDDQDRTLWDHHQIAQGMVALGRAARVLPAGPYTLQAAIASVHARASTPSDTDWSELVQLYDLLRLQLPGATVELNRAVALSKAVGPQAALDAVDHLAADPAVQRSHLFHAARASWLKELGALPDAVQALSRALERVDNDAERALLDARLSAWTALDA